MFALFILHMVKMNRFHKKDVKIHRFFHMVKELNLEKFTSSQHYIRHDPTRQQDGKTNLHRTHQC